MRLLHIIDTMNPVAGGPSQGIRNIGPQLMNLNIQVEIVCLDDPNAPYLAEGGFTVHALGAGKTPWQYNSKLKTWLKNNIGNFDVVILNGLWQYAGYAITKIYASFNKKNKKLPKLYIMPHGMLDPYFQLAEDRKLKAIRNWFYWKLIEKNVVKNADGLLFTCITEQRLARQTFTPYAPKKEINIGFGVAPPPKYVPAMQKAFFDNCPEIIGKDYILFLSRIHPKKGVDNLIEAYKKTYLKFISEAAKHDDSFSYSDSSLILENMPKLVIAGPGLETNFGQKIKKMVSEFPDMSSAIFFPGMLSGDAKWGAFYNCDVFSLPSHQENFGIAVVEALACGKPVLISNRINIWEEIEKAGAGLVSEDSFIETQKMLNTWIDLPLNTKKKMETFAKTAYQSYFTVEQAAKQFIESILQNE